MNPTERLDAHTPTTPRRSRQRSWRTLAIVAVASLALAACGNSSDDTSDEPDATQPATSEAIDAETETTANSSVVADTVNPDESSPTSAAPTTEPADDESDLGEFQPISGVPGVTDDEIQFGVMATGPSNPIGLCILECYSSGVQAYFDYRNALGGVHGRQLTITHTLDDEVGAGQVKMLELIGSDDVFGIFYSPLILGPGIPETADAGVPVFSTVQSGPAAAGLDNVYQPGVPYCPDCVRKAVVHTAVLAGATRIAVIGLGASQASKDCVALTADTFRLWGPDLGMEVVYTNDTLPFGLPNGVAPEVTAMDEAGVDYIHTCMDQNGVLTLEQELQRQGLAEVTVVLPQGYTDAEWLANNANLLEGDVFGSVFFRPFEADLDGTLVDEMIAAFEAGGVYVNDLAVQGWINADMAVTGILEAGPQFDRAGMIAGLNGLTDYDAGGVLPSLDMTKQHLALTGATAATDGPAVECIAPVFVRDGQFTLVNDPATPFFAYDRTTSEWTEPEPSSC